MKSAPALPATTTRLSSILAWGHHRSITVSLLFDREPSQTGIQTGTLSHRHRILAMSYLAPPWNTDEATTYSVPGMSSSSIRQSGSGVGYLYTGNFGKANQGKHDGRSSHPALFRIASNSKAFTIGGELNTLTCDRQARRALQSCHQLESTSHRTGSAHPAGTYQIRSPQRDCAPGHHGIHDLRHSHCPAPLGK